MFRIIFWSFQNFSNFLVSKDDLVFEDLANLYFLTYKMNYV